jgi:hypothetical protein
VAATFNVINVNDSGAGSLRQAVIDANTAAGADTIVFNIPGAGLHTIALLSALPALTEPVTVDGFTQPGSSPNTNGPGLGDNSVHLIEINGTSAGAGSYAFSLDSASSGSTFQGLAIQGFQEDGSGNGGGGFFLNSSSGNTIAGNFIGTDATGLAGVGNQGSGLFLLSASVGNTIGGNTPGARNVISGNGHGAIGLGNASTSNLIEGNFIGPNAAGTAAIPNQPGGVSINVFGVGDNVIGGVTPSARNVISGNLGYGVDIENGANNNVVEGNFIGTDVTGALPVPNGQGGLLISDGFSGPANDNVIGGTGPGQGNVIAFNNGNGVTLSAFQGNANVGNAIRTNVIFGNTGLGIDLGDDGVTPNDAGDADAGHNNLQNYPVITSVDSSGNVHIVGTLNSIPSTLFFLDFFASATCDPSGNGEAETYLGTAQVTTDAGGNAAFDVTLPVTVPVGQSITATATDNSGNTSELSACTIVGGGPTPTLTPTTTATPTLTPIGGSPTATPVGGVAAVPTLSLGWQILLVLALAVVSVFVLRRY